MFPGDNSGQNTISGYSYEIIDFLLKLVQYLQVIIYIHSQSQQEKCDVVENSAYGVHVQSSAGDRLEPDYNMENNPLYEMRILSNEGHSQKTETLASVPVYETVDIVTV